MVDFGKSDKMIKISGKVDKSNTTDLVVIFCSLFNEELLSLKKEENITTKPIVSVWFIHIYQPLHSGRIWHKVNF